MSDPVDPASAEPDALERAAQATQAGIFDTTRLIETFLGATVHLPSSTDPATTGVTPVLTDINGIPHMAVASSTAGLAATQHVATYSVQLTGRQIIEGLTPEGGLVINLSHGGFQFTPDVIQQIRKDHLIRSR